MLADERRQQVREIIEEKGPVTVEDIVTKFSVSAVTPPSHLDVLAKTERIFSTRERRLSISRARSSHPGSIPSR
jgi:DeoR/GlpR family transcriptional regulator of sugar metabolism